MATLKIYNSLRYH